MLYVEYTRAQKGLAFFIHLYIFCLRLQGKAEKEKNIYSMKNEESRNKEERYKNNTKLKKTN